jgi:predicted nucleic acid-binding protein
LITEDLSHGFTWQGLTVVNPFIGLQHPLLGQALTE